MHYTFDEFDMKRRYDYGVDVQYTMNLLAGDVVVFVVMTASNTGQNEDVTLHVEIQKAAQEASTYEVAISQTWYFDMASDDNYILTFTSGADLTSGTVTLDNYWMGNYYGSSTYEYSYDEANGFTLVCTSDDNLLQWYFGGVNMDFDATFTTLVVGAGYKFQIKA